MSNPNRWPRLTSLLVVLMALAASPALADRGSIPFDPTVEIFEPRQRAMLAWNGEEQIMLLSTDLHASAPTKVLEVLPLPAEPKVAKGDVEVFRKAAELIRKKLGDLPLGDNDGAPSRGGGGADDAAGEVTFHEKIGAHDVTVVKVLDQKGFVTWVNEYLTKAGVENPKIPDAMTSVIDEYLADGYQWFVFDVVELTTEPRTNDAIEYHFACDKLYYPLRITRVERGETDIRLIVLTEKLLREFPALPASFVKLVHSPVTISGEELHELSPAMHTLLGEKKEQKLRVWRIHGKLDEFKHDLLAK